MFERHPSKQGIDEFIRLRVNFLLLLIEIHSGRASMSSVQTFPLHWRTCLVLINTFKPANRRTKELPKKFRFSSQFLSILPVYKRLLDYLNVKANRRRLICGRPSQLINEEQRIVTKIFGDESTYLKNANLCALIFDYDAFTKKDTDQFNAFDLATMLAVNTCPYCNRQYTFTVVDGSEITRPEFDHFYHQSDHPILSLSFYNLIPSCHICNSTLKGDKIRDLMHPYFEGFCNAVKFSFKFVQVNKDLSAPENFEIDIVNNAAEPLRSKVNANIELFRLKEIYKHHRDILGEIYVKSRDFDQQYVVDFYQKFPAMRSYTSDNDIYRFYFGAYLSERDFDQRILSKLIKDVFEGATV